MNCVERQDSLLQYALGTLSGPELEELRAHLQTGCPACAGYLAETQSLLALLPLSLPPISVPPSARRRVLARIEDGEANPLPALGRAPMRIAPRDAKSRYAWWQPMLGGAAAAACITIAVFSNILSSKEAALQAKIDRKDRQLHEVQSTVDNAQDLLHMIEAPSVKVVNLPGQPRIKGNVRLIYDPASHAIRIYASNLKPLPPGKGYELWLFNGGKAPMDAGAFVVNAKGDGYMKHDMPTDPGRVVQVAITDEPFNGGAGVPAPPTGTVQFLQKLD